MLGDALGSCGKATIGASDTLWRQVSLMRFYFLICTTRIFGQYRPTTILKKESFLSLRILLAQDIWNLELVFLFYIV